MESNDELKETDMKNCTCYYFDDIMTVGDFNFDNILLGGKLHENPFENILIFDISYKMFMPAKPLRNSFNKVDQFIKIYDGTRYGLDIL